MYDMNKPRREPLPPVGDLKELVAWQVAMDLAEAVYKATRGFPSDERFGLRLQLRRAAVSVASNVAEGHGRINRREYARFVLIARGSLKETETQILLSQRLGYMDAGQAESLLGLSTRANKLITGLKRRLRGE
ncbi:MAG TPA: four helix bundle protein [Gemmatimonadaceae bacterium]|nr:four helix bundle protein [Gemmatimonadaceae bacterium]